MKAYLDSNVVISIVKDDTPAESDSLNRLLAAYDEEKVDLVTSELTHKEISTYQGGRQPYERTFRLLHKVPIVRWDELLGINTQVDNHTTINTPMIQNDPIYNKLLALGVETVDAQHLFVATEKACEVFLTCDKGILTRRDAIKALCWVIVQKPSEFVEGQGW